jgi:hypothetical protein
MSANVGKTVGRARSSVIEPAIARMSGGQSLRPQPPHGQSAWDSVMPLGRAGRGKIESYELTGVLPTRVSYFSVPTFGRSVFGFQGKHDLQIADHFHHRIETGGVGHRIDAEQFPIAGRCCRIGGNDLHRAEWTNPVPDAAEADGFQSRGGDRVLIHRPDPIAGSLKERFPDRSVALCTFEQKDALP